ncbi:alpha/beta hydrolase [Puteibacter caeruleilacunae]|nr:alpha/beta hydrolase [Puteibacter caeruleilacunae]
MKIKLLILFLSFSVGAFSQMISDKKSTFIYKVVDNHEIKANIFLPETIGLHPVVVYFHGGGFMFGNRDKGLNGFLKDKLLEKGYAVVSADYRLAPETKLDGIIEDVGDVIDWLRKNGVEKYGVDKNKIAVAGGSAGGYLALTAGFNKSNAPNAIIAISTPTGFSKTLPEMGDLSLLKEAGPYEIVKDSPVSYGDYSSRMNLWRFLVRNRLANYELFGFDPSKDRERLKQFTLVDNIDEDYPPVLVVHAKYDRLINLKDVTDFQKFLGEKKVANEFYFVNFGHSSELINQNPDAVDKMVEFLKNEM